MGPNPTLSRFRIGQCEYRQINNPRLVVKLYFISNNGIHHYAQDTAALKADCDGADKKRFDKKRGCQAL